MNVVIQKHLIPAPGAQASILPFALSAIDNAYLEEQRAKELKGLGDDVMDLVFMLADTFLGYK